MAGIDKVAIAFTIAIVAAGVGMALYGESIQNTPTASAPVISEPPAIPMEEPEAPMEEPEAPMEEPEAPMEEPEAPMEEPEAPMEEPEAPMEEPEAPMEEPEAPMEEPEAPMEEPEAPMEVSSSKTVIVDMPVGTAVPGCETTNECYIPASVTINVGDTVEWVNSDTAAHTVTSGTLTEGPTGEFDSSLILGNATFAFTFEESGSYDYFCLVHPWMVGDVQVN